MKTIKNSLAEVLEKEKKIKLFEKPEDGNNSDYGNFKIKRFFTKKSVHPFNEVNWVACEAKVGKFEQKNVEFPDFWSDNAVNITASKYFRGKLNAETREWSLKQMINRVTKTFRGWGEEFGYFENKLQAQIFEDELSHLLLYQKASFNSPVWFNVGVKERPQCSACQPYRSLVSTPSGFYKIGEIVEKNLIGLPIYDSNGITNVIAVKNNGLKKVYKIILRNGTFIETTGDHLIKAVYERRTKPEWVRADELKTGMRLYLYPQKSILENYSLLSFSNFEMAEASGKTQVLTRIIPRILKTTTETSEAALAGWLQADGFVGKYENGTNNSWTMEFLAVTTEEKEWILNHLDIVFPNIHRKIRVTFTKKGTPITRIRLYGKDLISFIEKYSLMNRREKIRIPKIIWQSEKKVIAAYLRSIFQGEGYITLRGNSVKLAIATISKDWIHDIQVLLYGLGIYSRVIEKEEKRSNRQNLYELSIDYGSERQKFAEMIGFLSESKKEKLSASLKLLDQKNVPALREEEIVSIEVGKEEIVYDIQTASGEYLSNNVAVHNCFILSVEDDMNSILDWIRNEGFIFKGGSGSGINLSPLRSKMELLSGGGNSSGPVSFMRGADSVAGMIKSGGTTRRAAKMVVLNIDHPDVMDFICAKAEEEKKVRAFQDAGYDMSDLNNDAWTSIQFQNANNSVRITDDFMKSVLEDGEWRTRYVTTGETAKTYKAKELLGEIAEAAWACGDPGVQFDTVINSWHTCPNTGRINASNPCFTGDTRVLTNKGLISFENLLKRNENGDLPAEASAQAGKIKVFTDNRTAENPLKSVDQTIPERVMMTGINPVFKLVFSNGMEIKTTENHRFFTKNRGMVRADELKKDDQVVILREPTEFEEAPLELELNHSEIFESGWGGRDTKKFKPVNLPTVWTAPLANYLGYLVGDGSLRVAENANSRLSTASVVFGAEEEANELAPRFIELFESWGVSDYQNLKMPNGTLQLRISRTPIARFLVKLGVSTKKAPHKVVPKKIFEAPSFIQKSFLSGLFTADGCVFNGSKSRYVGLGSVSKKLLLEVQQILLTQGIFSRIYENEKRNSNFSYVKKDGSEVEYASAKMYDLRISGKSILRFKEQIGFLTTKKQEKLATLLKEHNFYKTEDEFIFLKEKTFVGNEFTYNLTEPKNHSYIANGFVVANCSEYMHLDDSACNLASINLMKFLAEDGSFMVEEFKQAIRTMILAQEISVGASSYPTPKITENAINFRELGLGFANLGALLMAKGLPYDSDEARVWGGAIASLLSGEAYKTSAEIASKIGAFNGYPVNREPMLNVIKKHRAASHLIKSSNNSNSVEKELVKEAQAVWDKALELGEKYGYRNSQVTVIAPTGTIAFMMDCDTTGIEPDFSLLKMKQLVGGGWMKIINQTVPLALKNLGYSEKESEDIISWIAAHGTVEKAPRIKEEHLATFDTAVRQAEGTRSISWKGHVKMVAAVQPFVSGAISKTFNMPEETTKEEIEEAYIMAWKLGIKAFAVYRDGSKASQPLQTSAQDKKESAKPQKEAERTRLPATRNSKTHKFVVAGHEGYLTYSAYDDGHLAEIFISIAKQGSTLAGLLDAFAISISVALQHGVPFKTLAEKFIHSRFEPSGYTENPKILVATSIIDYIFRYLALEFLNENDLLELGLMHIEPEMNGNNFTSDNSEVKNSNPAQSVASEPKKLTNGYTYAGTVCKKCGGMMVQSGSCYTCFDCGESSGGCL